MSEISECGLQVKRKRQSAPWAEFAEEFAASAKAYNELGNNLGRAFYSLQAEAVAEWCKWGDQC